MYYKPLPFDNKLEAQILSTFFSGISDVNKAHDYILMLNDDLFQNPFHRKLFEEFKHNILVDRQIGIPKSMSELDGDSTADFLENKFMEFQLEKAINDLKEVALRREIVKKSRELESKAYEQTFKRDDLIEVFNSSANEISGFKKTEKPTTLKTISKAIKRVQDAVNGLNNERIFYCHDALDSAMSIFRKQLHTYGADQGSGKTALALDCFRRQIKAGMNVVYFCTESSSDELLLRMIGAEMQIDMQTILTGEMNENVFNRFSSAIDDFKKQHENFWIVGLDDWSCTVSEANSILSKIIREYGHVEMVYWDFLQDILPPSGLKNIDILETIRLNVAGIKATTERHNVASTMLSQFRKEKGDRKPLKQDFWGASAIINASHIMSVILPEYKHEEGKAPPDIVPVWHYSVKTRLIKPWSRKLMFNGAHGIFNLPASQLRYNSADRPLK